MVVVVPPEGRRADRGLAGARGSGLGRRRGGRGDRARRRPVRRGGDGVTGAGRGSPSGSRDGSNLARWSPRLIAGRSGGRSRWCSPTARARRSTGRPSRGSRRRSCLAATTRRWPRHCRRSRRTPWSWRATCGRRARGAGGVRRAGSSTSIPRCCRRSRAPRRARRARRRRGDHRRHRPPGRRDARRRPDRGPGGGSGPPRRRRGDAPGADPRRRAPAPAAQWSPRCWRGPSIGAGRSSRGRSTSCRRPRRALLSVSDKAGLADLGAGLVARGFELVSTGGTARALREAGSRSPTWPRSPASPRCSTAA